MNILPEKEIMKSILVDVVVEEFNIEEQSDLLFYERGSFYINGTLLYTAFRVATRALNQNADITWTGFRDAVIKYFNAELFCSDDNDFGWYFKFDVIKG